MRFVTLSLILAFTGCTSHSAGGILTLASSKSLTLDYEVLQRDVTARRCTMQNFPPPVDEAIDLAIRSVPDANAMANVFVENTNESYIVAVRTCVGVRGDAVRIGR